MKALAVTLVHKGAMEIALHAVSSFARHFAGSHRLNIHTDGSPDEEDERQLLQAATGIEAGIVRPLDRAATLAGNLADRPRTRQLLDGVGYNAKLELPMVIAPPYFYFDSDIVWLRPVSNLQPTRKANAFSTESWSWYNGAAREREWIRQGTPRRVNSGFYYLGEPFPFERMEQMLERGLFDPSLKYNTDQEIMAYLYPDMEMYHPEDLKRSRRSVTYDLAHETAAALHFPGGMWCLHLQQMNLLKEQGGRKAVAIRYQAALPVTRAEFIRMRLQVRLSDSPLFGRIINMIRAMMRRGR